MSFPYVNCECIHCGRNGKYTGDQFENRFDEPLTMRSVGQLAGAFRCSQCSHKQTKIFDHTGRLLIDSKNFTPCAVCGQAIPLPRLAAMPGSNICIACADDATMPHPAPPHPQPPPDMRECPHCGRPTVVRQNNTDLNYFLGCTGFPRCHWTSPMP